MTNLHTMHFNGGFQGFDFSDFDFSDIFGDLFGGGLVISFLAEELVIPTGLEKVVIL